jgi:1-acyl-sn-glycerol-3-phosphate acyltransferase
MNLVLRITNQGIKSLTRVLCKVHNAEALEQIPRKGPLIIACNHINFMEVPLVYTHLLPRPITGFAKIETWDNRFLGWLFTEWGAIPIRRGEADMWAIKQALLALQKEYIVAIAPEGTRSYHGKLQIGHPGIVFLAALNGAPIFPMVFYGHEKFESNLRRLHRTDFYIRIGEPFRIKCPPDANNKGWRRQATDEIMYKLASLLPPEYRGEYSNTGNATHTYLEFISPLQ